MPERIQTQSNPETSKIMPPIDPCFLEFILVGSSLPHCAELVCVANSVQQKWCYVTSKISLSENDGFWFGHSLFGSPHQLSHYENFTWGRREVSSQQSRELKPMLKPCGWVKKQIFQPKLSLLREIKPEIAAKPLLDSWHTETRWKNYMLFQAAKFWE